MFILHPRDDLSILLSDITLLKKYDLINNIWVVEQIVDPILIKEPSILFVSDLASASYAWSRAGDNVELLF